MRRNLFYVCVVILASLVLLVCLLPKPSPANFYVSGVAMQRILLPGSANGDSSKLYVVSLFLKNANYKIFSNGYLGV